MKKLFLDSANIDDIRKFLRSNAISGVTTNPSLMAKEAKGDYFGKLEEIVGVLLDMHKGVSQRKHLSVEVTTLDPEKIFEQAEELHRKLWNDFVDVYIKIPVTLDNLEVITRCSRAGIQVNATACMTAHQAKLADDAGANIVSFFYNRIKDGAGNPVDEISRYREIMRERSWESDGMTRSDIIAGSIRNKEDVYLAWSAGADIVTASPKIISELISHPQTDKAIRQFQEDIEKWLS